MYIYLLLSNKCVIALSRCQNSGDFSLTWENSSFPDVTRPGVTERWRQAVSVGATSDRDTGLRSVGACGGALEL